MKITVPTFHIPFRMAKKLSYDNAMAGTLFQQKLATIISDFLLKFRLVNFNETQDSGFYSKLATSNFLRNFSSLFHAY